MTSRKDEFRALMKRQLDALHQRIAEFERLAHDVTHGREHAISWDTTVSECRKKHLATMRRLHELDDQGEESWHEVGTHVRDAIDELDKAVARHENGAR